MPRFRAHCFYRFAQGNGKIRANAHFINKYAYTKDNPIRKVIL